MIGIGNLAKRIGWLSVASLVLVLVVVAIRESRATRNQPPWSDWRETQVSPAELAEITKDLRATEKWFSSRHQIYAHYTSQHSKRSDCDFQDYRRTEQQFPDIHVTEALFPDLKREWNRRCWFALSDERLAWEEDSDATGYEKSVWDGEKLVGVRRYLTSQPMNYYYFRAIAERADLVLGGVDAFPNPFGSAGWAKGRDDEAQTVLGVDDLQCLGELEYQGQPCLVLAGSSDNASRWIVGRYDHRIYGRRLGNCYWVFAGHREVAPGIFWPMRNTFTFYEGRVGDWRLMDTTETTVDAFVIDQPPSRSLFDIPLQKGVQVHDFRQEEVAVYPYDPDRTQVAWQAIQDDIDQRALERQAYEARVAAIQGRRAPPFGNGKWLNSPPLTLAELEGKRTMIGFTAVGCVPCENMLAQFATRIREKGTAHTPMLLVFLASDSEQSVRDKLAKFHLSCPVFIPEAVSTDPRGAVFQAYAVEGYPTVVTIDGNGQLVRHRVAPLGLDDESP